MPIFDFANHPPQPVDLSGCKDCGHRGLSMRGRYYCERSGRSLEQTKRGGYCEPCQPGNPYVPVKLREEQGNGDTGPVCY